MRISLLSVIGLVVKLLRGSQVSRAGEIQRRRREEKTHESSKDILSHRLDLVLEYLVLGRASIVARREPTDANQARREIQVKQ